jgi:hypothetical protein
MVKRLPWGLQIGLSWFLTALLAAQDKTFVPSSDVSLKISTERKSFKVGEAIALRYRIKNISNAAVFVPREWEATCPVALTFGLGSRTVAGNISFPAMLVPAPEAQKR